MDRHSNYNPRYGKGGSCLRTDRRWDRHEEQWMTRRLDSDPAVTAALRVVASSLLTALEEKADEPKQHGYHSSRVPISPPSYPYGERQFVDVPYTYGYSERNSYGGSDRFGHSYGRHPQNRQGSRRLLQSWQNAVQENGRREEWRNEEYLDYKFYGWLEWLGWGS